MHFGVLKYLSEFILVVLNTGYRRWIWQTFVCISEKSTSSTVINKNRKVWVEPRGPEWSWKTLGWSFGSFRKQTVRKLRKWKGERKREETGWGRGSVPRWDKFVDRCNTVLLSHWLEPPQEEWGLNSRPKMDLKVLTVEGCHLRTLLPGMEKGLVLRRYLSSTSLCLSSSLLAPCPPSLYTYSGNSASRVPVGLSFWRETEGREVSGQTTAPPHPVFAVGPEPQLNALPSPPLLILKSSHSLLVSVIKLVVWKP